jgi:polyphenol oxidase
MSKLCWGISGKDCSSLEDFLRKYQIREYVISEQIHEDKLCYCAQPGKVKGFDALFTDQENLTLIVKAADCVPILLHAPGRNIIAAVHAGRKGTEMQITRKVLEQLQAEYSVRPSEIWAWIGPSICEKCYQIDRAADRHYDLWGSNKKQLQTAGVRQIEISGICTACTGHEQYYSYRRDQTELRNYAFIRLE